ncbi:hypothetical protein BD310DRAFT_926979 [Dichomitus squalens]|uniref:Uncharacterized protein n=1 Tax=Dichomitus squalens TaxID=114155 RepID=A0A4Q9PVG7_9APHY|nr:hypothetical protein BD310DRAFT_926979 [Dichomitus squalens]
MENDVAGLRWGMARRRQTPPGDDFARTAGRGGFLSLVGRLRSGLRSVLSARQGDHLISLSKWLQRRERHCIVGPAPSSHPRATEHRRYLHCTQLYQYQYTYSNIAEPFECHITPRLEIMSTQLFCQAPLCCVAIPYVVDSDGSRAIETCLVAVPCKCRNLRAGLLFPRDGVRVDDLLSQRLSKRRRSIIHAST